MPGSAAVGLEGGCLCGAIRYRLLSPPADCGYCHCSLCRRASGAPLLLFATVPRSGLAMLRGAPRHHRSSPAALRGFCGDCGTQLYMRFDAEPATVDVTVASLDTPDAVAPTFHIWHGARLAGFDTTDALPRYPRNRPREG
jgi:hypothetical protein